MKTFNVTIQTGAKEFENVRVIAETEKEAWGKAIEKTRGVVVKIEEITYKQAVAMCKKEKSGNHIGDAGSGWEWNVYYAENLKRVLSVSINPNGMRV